MYSTLVAQNATCIQQQVSLLWFLRKMLAYTHIQKKPHIQEECYISPIRHENPKIHIFSSPQGLKLAMTQMWGNATSNAMLHLLSCKTMTLVGIKWHFQQHTNLTSLSLSLETSTMYNFFSQISLVCFGAFKYGGFKEILCTFSCKKLTKDAN